MAYGLNRLLGFDTGLSYRPRARLWIGLSALGMFVVAIIMAVTILLLNVSQSSQLAAPTSSGGQTHAAPNKPSAGSNKSAAGAKNTAPSTKKAAGGTQNGSPSPAGVATPSGVWQPAGSSNGGGGSGGNGGTGGTGGQSASIKKLILHQQAPPSASFLAQNRASIDTLPFDGTTFTINSSFKIQTTTPVSQATIASELSPLRSVSFSTVRHNFVVVYAKPAGLYSNYGGTVQSNFTNLAKAASDAGLAGIFFDVEEYFGDTWESACGAMAAADCQAAAYSAGTSIVQSMKSQWPGLKLFLTYGAWASETLTNDALNPPAYNDVAYANPTVGHFIAGLVAGTVGNGAQVIDGGEIYTQNTLRDVQTACNWFKGGMAAQSSIVRTSLKPFWAAKLSCGMGVYDFPIQYQGKGPGTPAMWQNDLTISMQGADEFAWAYSERYNWTNNPDASDKPAVPAGWLTASRNGWLAGKR